MKLISSVIFQINCLGYFFNYNLISPFSSLQKYMKKKTFYTKSPNSKVKNKKLNKKINNPYS